MIVIKTPAKIIIFGEHFIVAKGSQAILTTVGLDTTCTIGNVNDKDFHVSFKSATFNLDVQFSQSEAIEIFSAAQKLHDQYRKDQNIKPLKELIKANGNFFRAIIGFLSLKYSISTCSIKFECKAPLGSGMGTSASIASSMIAAILKNNQIDFSKQELFNLTKTIEDLQHGSSSGADPAAIINGGLLHYEHKQNGERSFRTLKNIKNWDKDLYLVHTGPPQESTGEMVAISKDFQNTNPIKFNRFLNRSNQICNEFIKSCDPDIFPFLNESGLMLEEIGVVSNKVIEFSKMIRSKGGAIKIAGAGGRVGDGSGLCLVIIKNKNDLKHICNQFNFKLLNAPLMVAGIDI